MITEESSLSERIVLVVQGTHIVVERSSLALVSKFFRALFSHKFEDSQKEVLHLDTGGEMGLTVAAVQTLAEFARTKQVRMPEEQETAVQVFIAADALDIEEAREEAETFLGVHMLRPDKVTFLTYWRMSKTFYMRTLGQFLDNLCLNNFGWFYSSLGRGGAMTYMAQWDMDKMAARLLNKKFKNCNEEQIFDAVLCYCKSKSDSGATFDNLVPGLYKSCGAYLKYIQSVPRTLTLKTPRK